jgi:hypothetical protein
MISESDRNRIEQSRIARYEEACGTCDGGGCPCMRSRDWQSIEGGCKDGCPECGLATCEPLSRDDVKLAKWEAAREDGQ